VSFFATDAFPLCALRPEATDESLPRPPNFDDKYKERAYWKGRLAAAFRIFGKYGYDEGVAGKTYYSEANISLLYVPLESPGIRRRGLISWKQTKKAT
jgi:hypothetical protein